MGEKSGYADIPETELRKAIDQLYQWQYGVRQEENFTIQLFTLLQKAKPEDMVKLALSYPAEAKAYQLWYQSSDPVEFFVRWGVWKGPRLLQEHG